MDPKGSGTNRNRYVVASQDGEVRESMRGKVGVPIVYVNRSVMILEPMARASERVREREERGKIRAGTKRGGDQKRKRDDDGEEAEAEVQEPRKKKVKGPKGPNPLSVKKAKKVKPVGEDQQVDGVKRVSRSDENDNEGQRQDEGAAVNDVSEDVIEGARKRKRRRKPKDTAVTENGVTVPEEHDD